jgi:ubiquinone/menaquinone biosynthesis C-methylase UbiE
MLSNAMNSKLNPLNSKLPAYAGLVRWAFTRFYREFAWTYDTVAAAVSAGQWFGWGRVVLPYLSGRVLELGCGTGRLQQALADTAAVEWAIGLDASPQMIGISRRRLMRDHLPPRLVQGLAQALPFPYAALDAVVATFPSEYILDRATLAETRRVLRTGGRLVIALAATFGEDGLYQRGVDLLYRLTLQRSPRALPDRPDSLVGRRMAELGFTVEERWERAGGSQVHLVIGERA